MSSINKNVDPTFLRTVNDGLASGKSNKDNPASIPDGLIGIYEDEVLPPSIRIEEREKYLEFLSAWVLLQKEVSMNFVASLLGWTEVETSDYLSRCSNWFNSPITGKYVLYHERLRSFVLQKIPHAKIIAYNESIIRLGQESLHQRTDDEWEYYALEHLSSHLLIQAMETGDANALKFWAYNPMHWNRQIDVSMAFGWGKHLLNDMMVWASKHDDGELIECALKSVELYHLEQNDAPRIVQLVSKNEMDIALQRIKSFGGNDQDGLRRKFIVYMLCLFELTLMDSRNQPFKKEALTLLLKDIEEQIPVSHEQLSWGDFFSGKLMFKMSLELAELEIDYLMLFRRTSDWQVSWKGQSTWSPESDKDLEFQFKVVIDILNSNSNDFGMDGYFRLINVSIDLGYYAFLDELLNKQEFYTGNYDGELIELAKRLIDVGLVEKSQIIYNKIHEQLWTVEDAHSRLLREFGIYMSFPECQKKASELEMKLRSDFILYQIEQRIELAELLGKYYIINIQLVKLLDLIDELPNEDGHRLQSDMVGSIYFRDTFVVNLLQPLFWGNCVVNSDDVVYLVEILEKIVEPSERFRCMNGIINVINQNGFVDEFNMTKQLLDTNPNDVTFSENASLLLLLFKSNGNQAVLDFVKKINDDYLRCLALKEFVVLLDSEGFKEEVLFFWDLLQNELSVLKDLNGRAVVLSQLCILFVNYFDLDFVIRLVDGIDVAWKRNYAKKEIINQLLKQSRIVEAHKLYGQIELDEEHCWAILNRTIDLDVEHGNLMNIFNQMFAYLKRYNKIDAGEGSRFNYMREIVQIAENEDANHVVNILNDNKKRDIVRMELVKKILKTGDKEEAIKGILQMEKGERKEHLLSEIAVEEYANNPETTSFLMQQLNTITFKFYTEARIIQKYIDVITREEILNLIDKMFVEYKSVIESTNRYSNAALAMLLNVLLKLGELQRAKDVFAYVEHGNEETKTSVRVRCFMKLSEFLGKSENEQFVKNELEKFIAEIERDAQSMQSNHYYVDLMIELIKNGAVDRALLMYADLPIFKNEAKYYSSKYSQTSVEVRLLKTMRECAGETISREFLSRFVGTNNYFDMLSVYVMESVRLNGLDSLLDLSNEIHDCSLHSEISRYFGSKSAGEKDLNESTFTRVKSMMNFRYYKEFVISFVEHTKMETLNQDKLIKILKLKMLDPQAMSKVLQKYFVKGVFTGEINMEKIRSAQEVLRLDWALNLKNGR